MSGTLVYAIGGTGAKLAEAVVHLCAAGLVEGRLTMRLIDQDQANGNAQRMQNAVLAYNAARAAMLGRQPESGLANRQVFGAALEARPGVLRVVDDVGATLASAFGMAGSADHAATPDELLMQALFNEAERDTPMTNGFRGRPGVGAAVFLSPASRGDATFWSVVDADVEAIAARQFDHVLFLGSAFGGTGAAGIPTLARHIRAAAERRCRGRGTPPPRMGVVVMLRYFSVAGQREYGPARPEQMKAALEFYTAAMESPREMPELRLADALYLCGLQREAIVQAEDAGGGPGQANPSLLAETIGALGAAHFINGTDRAQATYRGYERTDQPIFLAGHDKPDQLSWSDLPSPFADGFCPGDALRDFARFALYYCYGLHGAPALSAIPHAETILMYARYLDSRALTRRDYDIPGQALAGYLQIFLRWFGVQQAPGGDAGIDGMALNFGEWGPLVVPDPSVLERCRLRTPPAESAGAAADALAQVDGVFRALETSGAVGGRRGTGMNGVHAALANGRIPATRGIPAWAAAAFRAVSLPQ